MGLELDWSKEGSENICNCRRYAYDEAGKTISELRKNFGNNDPHAESAIKWLDKKGLKHVSSVLDVSLEIAKNPEFLKESGFSKQDAHNFLGCIAALHDIGRAKEINTQTAATKEKFDHALESANMLEQEGITDPYIIIPTKYHGVMSPDEVLTNDKTFQNLSADDQQKVRWLLYAIRDTDKIANLAEKSVTGIKGCAEERDPNLHNYYIISDEVKADLDAGRQVKNSGVHTHIDAILRFAGWANDIKLASTKSYIADNKIVTKLFAIAKEYAKTAKDIAIADNTFDEKQYLTCVKTLDKLEKDLSARLEKNIAPSVLLKAHKTH